MKQRIIYAVVLVMYLSHQGYSQIADNGKGVTFLKEVNWDKVLEKAKKENKNILVDFMATWCGPCKQMDQLVFTDKRVADVVNDNYLAIKVQIDSSASDNAFVRAQYGKAKEFQEKFAINSVPTYIIFSKDGQALHRISGYKQAELFIDFANDGLDPKRQLYTQLENYRAGQLASSELGLLASNVLHTLQDKALSLKIVTQYINNYLDSLFDEALLTKFNLPFLSQWTDILTSKNRSFQIILKNKEKVNKAASTSRTIDIYSKIILPIISREEIWAKGANPNWNKCQTTIRHRYGTDIANQTILEAQMLYYEQKEVWDKAISAFYKKYKLYGIDTLSGWGIFNANNFLDRMSHRSLRKSNLDKAIEIASQIVSLGPSDAAYIDTYASLLYISGRRQEAIQWQEKAVELLRYDDKEIREKMEKMKANIALF